MSYGHTDEQGRQAFIKDVAELLQQYNIGWAWWVFRGTSAWKGGAMNLVANINGEEKVDQRIMANIKDVMSDTDK